MNCTLYRQLVELGYRGTGEIIRREVRIDIFEKIYSFGFLNMKMFVFCFIAILGL